MGRRRSCVSMEGRNATFPPMFSSFAKNLIFLSSFRSFFFALFRILLVITSTKAPEKQKGWQRQYKNWQKSVGFSNSGPVGQHDIFWIFIQNFAGKVQGLSLFRCMLRVWSLYLCIIWFTLIILITVESGDNFKIQGLLGLEVASCQERGSLGWQGKRPTNKNL